MARKWASAWERGDYPAMHALLSERARRRASLKRFVRTYRQAAETVTLSKVRAGTPRRARRRHLRPAGPPADEDLRPAVGQRAPAADRRGRTARASTGARSSCSPACASASGCSATTTLAARGAILARDGTPLAKGPDRLSDLGPLAAEVAGRVGPAPPERADELARRGVPEGAPVGLNGLEREFDERLSGTPGGILRAGARVIARAEPRAGVDVRSAIDPDIQRAAVEALAGRFGGIAVLRPTTGEVLGLSGVAFSAPQPPGSTFKIVTLAGALEASVVKPRASFPVQTETTLEGVKLQQRPRRGLRRLAASRPSRTPATPSSRRSAPSSGPSGWSRRRSASASTRTPARPARPARRSPRPRRSATTWRSGRPRSARARCSPRRSSSPRWRRRSACAAAGSPRRSRAAARAPRRARRARAPRASSPASCARS